MIRLRGFVTALIIVGLTAAPSAYAEKITIEKDLLEQILQRQDTLEKQVRELQEQLRKRESTPPALPAETISSDVQVLQEDVDESSTRLDTVETRTILDKISIGGELRSKVENFDYDNRDVGGQEKDTGSNEIWTNRIRLNLRADITKNLIFRGRLGYFKFWGETDFGEDPQDYNYASVPVKDGDLHVEQAFIDYFIPQTPLSVTFGRLPTVEGPPNEYRNFTTRKATWPRLVTDAESDGVIANVALDDWTGLHNAMFRVGYSKINQNYLEYAGEILDDNRILAVAFETELPAVKDSLLWLSYFRVENVGPIRSLPEDIPLAVASYPGNVGDWDIYSLHLQINDIRSWGLDWFASASYLYMHNPDEGTVLGVPLPEGGVFPVNEVGVYGDLVSGDLGKNRDGYAFYTGFRYQLPIETLKRPLIGFEYNYGSKYWTGVLSAGSGDIVNKFDISGHGYELYYIQPIIDDHFFCRMGAVYIDYNHYNQMVLYGSRTSSDMNLTNLYFLADVRF